MSLQQDTITFGKYKGTTLYKVLRDRNYCKWLLEQDWFQTNYEWLYNRIGSYDPKKYFFKTSVKSDSKDFIHNYQYFNTTPIENLEIELSYVDSVCYKYYLHMIQKIKYQIYERLENEEENPYDIKAPTRWLKKFEEEFGINRNDFKEFMEAYELPNIPYIIERVKKEGGIEYKGAQSFKIAKARSKEQENWWERILKERYGEDLGTQFKYEKCIFDFLNISTKTIFECKLGLKDFDEEQHRKYKISLNHYRIIYLISTNCVIDMESKIIYTTDHPTYKLYIDNIPCMKVSSYLDKMITGFEIIEMIELSSLFGTKIANEN